MSKIQIPFRRFLCSKRFYLITLAIFVGLSGIVFTVSSQNVEQTSENKSFNLAVEEKTKKKSCCGASTENAVETQTLVGSYYSLKDGYDTILMFNNKGPQPLVVSPIFFSLNGERLDIPYLTIPATSYQEVDLRVLLVDNLPRFEEGSLQVSHQGMRLQLGAQFKILKQGVLFDEQFVTPEARFPSGKMESVWWMPSTQSETKFIVSNTTDSPVTATIEVDGTAPRQRQPAIIQLNPHQTRKLDILRDLVGQQRGGTLHKTGGISITHNGTPGAILARMLISRQSSGYSSVVGFTDPTTPRSSKLNGGGLRLGLIGKDELTPIVVARNIGSEPTTVSGRIPYTNENGDVVYVQIPEVQLVPDKIATLNVKQAIEAANVPEDITFAGIELEYTSAPGSVIMNAQSVSESGQQVFQVPLLDPQRMPSSAGGFPWKVDEDYNTIVFIKNETDAPKKYFARLIYEGGEYALGAGKIKAGQTLAIDFKQLRDSQTPDSSGNIIPPNIERGQIAWSMIGADNNTMSGRSEQVSTVKGVSSTYACYNCCPDSVTEPIITPSFSQADIGSQIFWGFQAKVTNCFLVHGYALFDGFNWFSSNISVAGIDSDGWATAMNGGTAYLTGYFEEVVWTSNGYYCLQDSGAIIEDSGAMQVRPRITSISPSRGGVGSVTRVTIDGNFSTFTPTVSAGSGISVSIFSISSTQIAADFTIAANATGGNRNVTVSENGLTSNTVNFFVQIPTSLKVLSVTIVPTDTTPEACVTGIDYGIGVAIKYQVNDQSNPSSPIKNNIMVPQETVTNLVINGGQPSNPFPTYDDLGPSAITGTSRTTDANGQFLDAPLGICTNGAFTASFVQNIRVLIDSTQTSYHVRTNNFAVASTASGQGSVTNNSDIQKSRP